MKLFAALTLSLLLAACGGGGGSSSGSSSSSSGTALNLQAAYNSLITNGSSNRATISGSCTGTSITTDLPSYSGKTWDSKSATVVDNIQVDTLTGSTATSTFCSSVFNSNENKVGKKFYTSVSGSLVPFSSGGTTNGQIDSIVYANQAALPTSVTAGTTGTFYTATQYDTGVAKESITGTYSVSAGDVAGTLLVTTTEAATLISSKQPSYTFTQILRLNANNTLTLISGKIETFAASPLGAGSANITVDSAAPTLNAGDAFAAQLVAGVSTTFLVKDNNGNQCSPNLITTQGALNSVPGTTANGVAYTKSNGTNFNPTTFSGLGNCSNFNLPISEDTYYGNAYQLLQATSNNGSGSSTNLTASSTSYPNGVTVGSTGQLYTYNRVNGLSTTPFATGNTIYFVGANTATTLMLYEVVTKTYTDGTVARQIFGSQLNANNTLVKKYAALMDGATFYLFAQ